MKTNIELAKEAGAVVDRMMNAAAFINGQLDTYTAAAIEQASPRIKAQALREVAILVDEYDLCNETGDTLKQLAASLRSSATELEGE